MARSEKITFTGALGENLAARLEKPLGPPRAWALFAHCFSCSKDIHAAQRIARRLTDHGIAVLRFDFTGLGHSDGDFANTNFSSNVDDLVKAAQYLRDNHTAASLLVGHSLGGGAVIAAAPQLAEVKAVATLGAPSDAEHVQHQFIDKVEQIKVDGEATVLLAGRPFQIKKQFLDDIEGRKIDAVVQQLKAALLIMHSPVDATVGIDNATHLFVKAKHPKSFVSLDDADHLLSKSEDAEYAADVIASWAIRYAQTATPVKPPRPRPGQTAVVEETGQGGFHSWAVTGAHAMIVDEPEKLGGLDGGPAPFDLLSASLAACTTMTLRMYARHKQIQLGRIKTTVTHTRIANAEPDQIADTFERIIAVDSDVDDDLHDKLLEIANKCPVHRTLEQGAHVQSRLD